MTKDKLVVYAKNWGKEYREEVKALANILGHPICGARNNDKTICQKRPLSARQLKRRGINGKPNGRCAVHGGYIDIHSLSVLDRLDSAITDKYRGKRIEFSPKPYLYLFKKCEHCPIAEHCPEVNYDQQPCVFEIDIMDNIMKTAHSNYKINSNMEKLQLMEFIFSYIRKFRAELYSTYMEDQDQYLRTMSIISKLTSDINRFGKDLGLIARKKSKSSRKKETLDIAQALSKSVKRTRVLDDGERFGIEIENE